jgi:uncharacterized phage-associated protein
MITSTFNFEKSINAVLYVASRLKRKDFHKIFKVLYFADKEHLSLWGRTITGDSYIAMQDGPVPSKIYDIFKAVRGDSYFSNTTETQAFTEYITVRGWSLIEPKKEAKPDLLSQSDIEALSNSIAKYGDMTWDEIREKSHDYAWRNTAKDHVISIKDIMIENGETEDYINFVTSQMELQTAKL